MQKLPGWSGYLDSDSNVMRSAVDFPLAQGKQANLFCYMVITGSEAIPTQKNLLHRLKKKKTNPLSLLICPAAQGIACEIIIMLCSLFIYLFNKDFVVCSFYNCYKILVRTAMKKFLDNSATGFWSLRDIFQISLV